MPTPSVAAGTEPVGVVPVLESARKTGSAAAGRRDRGPCRRRPGCAWRGRRSAGRAAPQSSSQGCPRRPDGLPCMRWLRLRRLSRRNISPSMYSRAASSRTSGSLIRPVSIRPDISSRVGGAGAEHGGRLGHHHALSVCSWQVAMRQPSPSLPSSPNRPATRTSSRKTSLYSLSSAGHVLDRADGDAG